MTTATRAGAGEDSPDFVASFARGLQVIQSFGPGSPRQTLSEVAARTGLSRAAARRFLLTLVALGLARTDGKHFELTAGVLGLGYAYLSSLDAFDLMQPHLAAVTDAFGESCSAAVLDGAEIVYVARSAARHRVLSIGLRVGSRLPAHATSMGQVLLAALPASALAGFFSRAALEPHTPATLTSRPALEARLAEVRDQGFALADEELELGLRSLAVPVRDRRGEVALALNVSTQAGRVSRDEVLARFLPALRSAASAIEAEIRHR